MLLLALFERFVWRGRSRPRNAYSRIDHAGNFRPRSLVALLALLTALTPWGAAQKAAPAHVATPVRPAVPRSNLPTANFAFGRGAYPSSGFRRSSHYPSPYTSLPFPFFGDSFTPDDIYSTGYPVASEPPPFLLQAARALAGSTDYPGQPDMGQPVNNREPTSSQPLMIELQNGRYVRVSRTAADGEALPLTLTPNNTRPSNIQPAKSAHNHSPRLTPPNSAPAAEIAAASPAHDLPPALLIFRDGHSEEVRDYTIAEGMLYARGDFYTDGYWNKKIDLSTLNLPQTLEENANRNVKFILPSSPNEVITRF